MTDGKPPSAVSGGPIARELAKWLRAIRLGWTESAAKRLPHKSRRLYAFAGSFTWMIGFVFAITGNPVLSSIHSVGVTLDIFGVLGVMIFFSLWFGWLVSFSKRKASPIRLFLDGLLLPTVTVSIIAFAMERIVQIPAELPASSQSPGITLATEGTGSEPSANPSAADPEEAGGESPAAPAGVGKRGDR